MSEDQQNLVAAIADMKETEAMELVRKLIDNDVSPLDILASCRAAMDIVGARFEAEEYFIPELVLAGEMLDQIGSVVKPLIKEHAGPAVETAGKVLIGTVAGDLHDIGKNIVTFMLDVNGFEVIDLGVDVPKEKFVEAIRTHEPQVAGLSGFLTLAFDSMKDTVEAIEAAGLREQLKISIGGGQVDEQVRGYTGADAFGLTAMDAVAQCKDWIAT